jgi:hypothetical protein
MIEPLTDEQWIELDQRMSEVFFLLKETDHAMKLLVFVTAIQAIIAEISVSEERRKIALDLIAAAITQTRPGFKKSGMTYGKTKQ